MCRLFLALCVVLSNFLFAAVHRVDASYHYCTKDEKREFSAPNGFGTFKLIKSNFESGKLTQKYSLEAFYTKDECERKLHEDRYGDRTQSGFEYQFVCFCSKAQRDDNVGDRLLESLFSNLAGVQGRSVDYIGLYVDVYHHGRKLSWDLLGLFRTGVSDAVNVARCNEELAKHPTCARDLTVSSSYSHYRPL